LAAYSFLRVSALWLAFLTFLSGQPSPNRVIGVVTEKSTSGFRVKTDSGQEVSVAFSPNTRFQRIAPGEKDLSKAQLIDAAAVQAGDRILARGTPSQDPGVLHAQSVIVMSQQDIAQKQAQERAEWLRGVSGIVVSTSPRTKEIVVRIPSLMQAREVRVILHDGTLLRRYAPDSVRFADARPCSLEEVKAGDQLRARGKKSEDGASFFAEEIVTGSFLTVAGKVTAINSEAKELQIQELDSGRALSVKITSDSVVRRFPQVPGGPNGDPSVMPGARPPITPSRGPLGANPPDLQQMLERMPVIALTDLKAGETIVVSSTKGAAPDRLTAITVVAGVERLLAMRQAPGGSRGQSSAGGGNVPPGGSWNLGDFTAMPMP